MLLTVTGEMLKDGDEGAWTVALLRVLSGLGIDDHAGRQVLARSASAGWLERERVGRSVRWHLADRGRTLVDEGVRRSVAYLGGRESWDGRWLVLYVSVPQHRRTTRKRLYGGLTWLGMGNPMPGIWLTPHTERADDLARLIASLDLQDTAFAVTGGTTPIGIADAVIVDRAWDLGDLADRYERFIAQESAAPDPADSDVRLFAYLDLLNLQQRFMRLDPQLPEALMPAWVGRRGAALFAELRSRWSEGAHARFWEIVEEAAPARAKQS